VPAWYVCGPRAALCVCVTAYANLDEGLASVRGATRSVTRWRPVLDAYFCSSPALLRRLPVTSYSRCRLNTILAPTLALRKTRFFLLRFALLRYQHRGNVVDVTGCAALHLCGPLQTRAISRCEARCLYPRTYHTYPPTCSAAPYALADYYCSTPPHTRCLYAPHHVTAHCRAQHAHAHLPPVPALSRI